MKISDLKFGMVVELKNGRLCLIEPTYNYSCLSVKEYLNNGEIENNVQFRNIIDASLECRLSDFNDNLIDNDICGEDFSIVKIYEDYTLKNLLWERKETLLTDDEREWLSAVIKPFRDKVECIEVEGKNFLYLEFTLNCEDAFYLPYIQNLPFKFKGLEKDKKYTLEELGL